MTAAPQPPPEAMLIKQRREALIPALSRRQAAKRAGFSPALWAKIEHGFDQVARGVTIPYAGTPDKVARAAAVVGITAAELEACGRDDAARVLASLPAPSSRSPDDMAAEMRAMTARLELMAAELEKAKGREEGDPLNEIRHASG